MSLKKITQLLASVPVDALAEIYALIEALVASEDPARTARRHAVMIAARTASEAIAKKALS